MDGVELTNHVFVDQRPVVTGTVYGDALCFDGVQGGKYYLIQNLGQFEAFMSVARTKRVISVDTETSGLNWVHSDVCGIVIGWSVSENFYLPINHKTDEQQLNIVDIRAALIELLGDRDTVKLFANAKFDQHGLRKLGIEVNGLVHDIIIIAHILDENAEHGVKPMALRYVDAKADKWEKRIDRWRLNESVRRRTLFRDMQKERALAIQSDPVKLMQAVTASALVLDATVPAAIKKACTQLAKLELADHLCAANKKDDISYDYIPLNEMTPYACADVHYTYLIYKELILQLSKSGDLVQLYTQELALSRLLLDTEHLGAKIDVAYLESLIGPFTTELEESAKEIYAAVGFEFNIASTKQLIEVFEKLNITLTKLSKTTKKALDNGEQTDIKYSVDKEVLEGLAAKYPFAAKIMSYRNLEKTKSTYVEGLVELVDSGNFVHPSFNQNVSTGRMSCLQPNLTNIPARDKTIRRAFIIPNDEYVYVFFDYCLAAGTLVDTPTGNVPIEDLRAGDFVYTFNKSTGRPDCSRVAGTKQTGMRETLVVVLDNGERVRCTPEHRWLRIDGSEVTAGALASGDRLLPLRRSYAGQARYETLYSRSSRAYVYAHQVVGAAKVGVEIGELYNTLHDVEIHHIDGNNKNNSPDNLKYCIASEHKSEHGKINAGKQWVDAAMRQRMSTGISTALAARGGHHGARNPNFGKRTGPSLTCAGCGCSFYKAPSMRARYCSTRCYRDGRAGVADLNHKVVAVERDGLIVPTFDIEVARDHNFALSAGVFVHNSQIEIRLTADRSQDPTLLSCYPFNGEGKDVHTITLADVVLRQPIEVVQAMKSDKTGHVAVSQNGAVCRCPACQYDFYRNIAKRVNFGIIYGAGPATIQRQVSRPEQYVPLEECREYIERYFRKYPGVKEWIRNTEAFTKKYGFVQNSFGRYRHLEIAKNLQRWQVDRLCRQSVNFMIQGEAADLFKTAALRVHKILKRENAKTRLVNFVHDEIQFYWHKSELHLLKEVKATMEDFDRYSIPIVAELAYSPTDWSTKKELKV